MEKGFIVKPCVCQSTVSLMKKKGKDPDKIPVRTVIEVLILIEQVKTSTDILYS